MEEARGAAEGDRAHEVGDRQEPAFAEERPELVDRHEKSDEVNEGERALEDQPRQPVVGRRKPVHGRG